MKAASPTSGLTVIELLVVMAVLGVVLSVLVAFFSIQVRTTSRTQAASEVEVKVRSAAELVMQDLQLAGSRMVVDNSGAAPVAHYIEDVADHCSPLLSSTVHCVSLVDGHLTLFYASSLRLNSEPCRRVDYFLDGTTLMRRELGCSEAVLIDYSDAQPFVLQVETFTIGFVCEEGSAVTDPLLCYTDHASFPHQATVSITARSENTREDRAATVQLTTTMPNMRPVAVSE